MTFKHEYDDMLATAYEKIPKIINIASRYHIPEIESLVQGNKTIIKKFPQLCKALRREQEHVLKFFNRELASKAERSGNEVAFTGRFRNEFLNQKLQAYVKEFLLCEQCGKPDTKLSKKDNITYKTCEACGAKNVVRTVK
jgi:translation initiation factor 2 subunit 2